MLRALCLTALFWCAVPAEAQPKSREVSRFIETASAPEKPFPWKAVGLGLFCLALSAPFAWLAYARTAKELSAVDSQGRKSRS